MTELEYRSHPAISRSELWKMHESPEKFKWYKEHPVEPTSELLSGSRKIISSAKTCFIKTEPVTTGTSATGHQENP